MHSLSVSQTTSYPLLLKALFLVALSSMFLSMPLRAATLTESSTGLTVEAAKKYSIKYNNDGTYTIKKKRSKLKATFTIGISPLSAKGTADDFIATSGAKVKKYQEQNGSVLLTLKKLGKLKNAKVRFRPVGSNGEMEVITYTGKKKKKKKKRSARGRNLRLTAGAIRAFDRIIQSRQGGLRRQLPVTIPTRTIRAFDGTSAVVPNLPGWTFDARDGIISGGNINQGIVNLGIPTLVLFPGQFFNGPVMGAAVPPGQAIANIWPQQAATIGANLRVLSVQQVPGTDGWLGQNFFSGLFAVRFALAGRTWQALMVSGVAPATDLSWLWYHSYIAIPEVGGSAAIGNALMNTWATWDNTNANAARLQSALNTIATTPLPGNPIDPAVFDAIHQDWVDYIKK